MAAEHADDPVLARLAAGASPFLGQHHLEAARRLERLVHRAAIPQKVTMSYDPARVGGRGSGGGAAPDLPDGAAPARRELNRLAAALPADCWGVLIDLLAFGKGLGDIETDRRWPRRAAKLVLRIGLEQLALVFGITEAATGRERGRMTGWLEHRPPLIPDEADDASP